jgi:hypothetical protein
MLQGMLHLPPEPARRSSACDDKGSHGAQLLQEIRSLICVSWREEEGNGEAGSEQ